MTVQCRVPIKCVSQEEFGDIAFAVMKQVFAIHQELGRFFDEGVYHRALASRLPNAVCEMPVDVSFDDFRTTLFVDLVVESAAIFELKAVEALVPRHRAQLLNYLMLTNSFHGKLVNMRPENVHHEFVNSTLTLADRTEFAIKVQDWKNLGPTDLRDWLVELLRDWGVGLDFSLYESAARQVFSANEGFPKPIIKMSDGLILGAQDVLQVAGGIAIRFSAVSEQNLHAFGNHLCRFLKHTSLQALHWVNMTRETVQFTTIV